MRFQVLRHSGQQCAPWRVIFQSDDLRAARARFTTRSADLRQGAVQLLDLEEDAVLEHTKAPRLRARW